VAGVREKRINAAFRDRICALVPDLVEVFGDGKIALNVDVGKGFVTHARVKIVATICE
jgi:hypothetical protein